MCAAQEHYEDAAKLRDQVQSLKMKDPYTKAEAEVPFPLLHTLNLALTTMLPRKPLALEALRPRNCPPPPPPGPPPPPPPPPRALSNPSSPHCYAYTRMRHQLEEAVKSERYDEATRLRVLMKEVGKPPLRRKVCAWRACMRACVLTFLRAFACACARACACACAHVDAWIIHVYAVLHPTRRCTH